MISGSSDRPSARPPLAPAAPPALRFPALCRWRVSVKTSPVSLQVRPPSRARLIVPIPRNDPPRRLRGPMHRARRPRRLSLQSKLRRGPSILSNGMFFLRSCGPLTSRGAGMPLRRRLSVGAGSSQERSCVWAAEGSVHGASLLVRWSPPPVAGTAFGPSCPAWTALGNSSYLDGSCCVPWVWSHAR